MKVKPIRRKEVKRFRVQGIEKINYMFSRVMLYCSNNPQIPVVTHSHTSSACKVVSQVLSKAVLSMERLRKSNIVPFLALHLNMWQLQSLKGLFPSLPIKKQENRGGAFALKCLSSEMILAISTHHFISQNWSYSATTCTKCKVTHGISSELFWLPQCGYLISKNYQGGNI